MGGLDLLHAFVPPPPPPPGKDLSTIIGQLLGWQVRKAVSALGQTPKGPWTTPEGAGGEPAPVPSKRQKYGDQTQQYIDEFQREQTEGWQLVFTDGSAKIVKGLVSGRIWRPWLGQEFLGIYPPV